MGVDEVWRRKRRVVKRMKVRVSWRRCGDGDMEKEDEGENEEEDGKEERGVEEDKVKRLVRRRGVWRTVWGKCVSRKGVRRK